MLKSNMIFRATTSFFFGQGQENWTIVPINCIKQMLGRTIVMLNRTQISSNNSYITFNLVGVNVLFLFLSNYWI
jgi:hypothetical protein